MFSNIGGEILHKSYFLDKMVSRTYILAPYFNKGIKMRGIGQL